MHNKYTNYQYSKADGNSIITATQKMEKEEKKERQRKESKRGVITQRMMTFRIDNELYTFLGNETANKGRYINELIKREKDKIERKKK